MKKQNKRGVSEAVMTVIMIALVLVAVGVIWVVVQTVVNQEHYSITEKVCVNGSNDTFNDFVLDGTNQEYFLRVYGNYQICHNEPVENITYEPASMNCELNLQGCKGQFEIDNVWNFMGIIGKDKVTEVTYCPDYLDIKQVGNSLYIGGNQVNISYFPTQNNTYVALVNNKYLLPVSCSINYQTISSKDLTSEWLGSSCECKICYDKTTNNRREDCGINAFCSNWNCFNKYEVTKQ